MNYKTTIGLEIHVQLKTKSKMFCGCDNNAENAAPNTLVCPVCLGLPGVLPVPNKQAIEWTLKTGLVLNAEIAEISHFDRKHYFYPDLPKNYQISQYDAPFCVGGKMEIRNAKGEMREIKIIRIHLEEDAGKLIHTKDATLIDFNRAGTPLLEIVTEPEISTPQEAKIFMQELRAILRYLSVSDANMEKGHLRCDANISISPIADGISQNEKNDKRYAISDKLGTPVEIKNLNSFRMVERALVYEEKRQRELLSKGEKVIKETRGWNDAKGETYPQRTKELVHDYRYFPEPDIPPFETAGFNIEGLKKEIPELPAEKRKRYIQEFDLSSQDAFIIASDKRMAEYFEKVAQKINPKTTANWLVNIVKLGGILAVAPQNLIELLASLDSGKISNQMAKDIFVEMLKTGKSTAEIIQNMDLKQTGEAEIDRIIEKILKENPKPVSDYQKGKKEALGFLVGMVMRETASRANPVIINKLLKERIENVKE